MDRKSRMFHVNIWILFLLLLAILICWLGSKSISPRESARSNQPQPSKPSRFKPPQDSLGLHIKPKNATEEAIWQKNTLSPLSAKKSVNPDLIPPEKSEEPEKSKGPETISQKIQNLDYSQALRLVQKKSILAKRIVPGFPSYPASFKFEEKESVDISSEKENSSIKNTLDRRHGCIQFLETLFPGEKFLPASPSWLINPKTKKKMKLNGYCERLKMAVEYYGIEHYDWPNFTGCTRRDFLKQKYRDHIKEQICSKNNVCLIQIPHTIHSQKIPLAVYARLLDGVPGLLTLF